MRLTGATPESLLGGECGRRVAPDVTIRSVVDSNYNVRPRPCKRRFKGELGEVLGRSNDSCLGVKYLLFSVRLGFIYLSALHTTPAPLQKVSLKLLWLF